MKSWGAIIITAVGFLLGVVLAGVGGISAKTSLISVNSKNQNKKIEDYWTETGLGKKELFELISNTNCQSTEKYFLSCVNSITQSLKSTAYLSTTTGEIENLHQNNLENNEYDENEKQKLNHYVMMYNRQNSPLINFEKIWDQLIDTEPNDSRAYLIASGINHFLSIYKDPHTYIMPGDYYEEVGSQIERSNLFVGVAFEKIRNQIIVRKVFKNSDAEIAGLEAFDHVQSINKKIVAELSLSDISQLLKDSNVKKFEFDIRRNNDQKIIQINRQYRNLSHVQFEILSGLKNFAVVTLTKFSRGVCEEVATKIRSASENNISGVILDLRDNPGGQLDEAACLAGLFLGMNKKTYSVEFFDPIKANEVVLSSGSLLYKGPLVVLMNSSSASASELLAGALQDHKRALLVGEKSFGKGTFQESEVWSKNPKISLFKTQGFYLLPSETSPQLHGIEPDIEFDENHLKIREQNTYFNPIENNKKAFLSASKNKNSYNKSLNLCLKYSDVMATKDLLLQRALQVLSCHRITVPLALEYSGDEFN